MTTAAKNELVYIPSDTVELEGMLELPKHQKGIVIFAHGSGSSRFSARNSYVAEVLRSANLGTLLMDLLLPAEERAFENRFNISLLTQRLVAATEWLQQ